jgi:ecotin
MNTLLRAALVCLLLFSTSLAADDMAAFPPAEQGMTRHVLRLPAQTDEHSLRIELILGRTVLTDAANRYFFGGAIEEEAIPGWGYTRYILRKLGPMAGTLMAADPAAPKVERFVTLSGEPYLIRYNSRLPVVVYAPTDVEVRWRVWEARPETQVMPEG